MDFAAGLAAELRHDGAGAADEPADGGRVAHEAERDLPREDLEHGALARTVSRGGVAALRRRRRLVIGVGGGGVLHCVACGFQRGIFFSCHAPRVESLTWIGRKGQQGERVRGTRLRFLHCLVWLSFGY